MKAIIGRKLGMTQVFDAKGIMIPVTVIEAGPLTITQKKTTETDGYNALQIAFLDTRKKLAKPQEGHFKKANVKAKKFVREIKPDNMSDLKVGDEIKCDVFKAGDVVDVSGKTKGRGFTGVIKRWNQRRLKMTHGTGPTHRSLGSTGANSDPSKKIKGLHMAGQYGHEKVTILNLEVVKADAAKNVLLIKGAIPGPKGALVTVRTAVKK